MTSNPDSWTEWLPEDAKRTFNSLLAPGLAVYYLNEFGVPLWHSLGLILAWLLVYAIAYVVVEHA